MNDFCREGNNCIVYKMYCIWAIFARCDKEREAVLSCYVE